VIVAFTRYSNVTFEERICIVNNDGTGLTILTTENNVQEHFPAFSPDGKKIAFGRLVKGGKFDICVMNSDGSGRINLTNTPSISEDLPDWSPDGKQIVFHSNNDICVMAADGTNLVKLTSDTAIDWVPVWSPDGRQIAFLSNRDGAFKWWVMNSDGSNQRLLGDIIVLDDAFIKGTLGLPICLLKATWSKQFPGTFFTPLLTQDKRCVITIDTDTGKQGTITYGDSLNYVEAPAKVSPVVTLYSSNNKSFDIYNAWGQPVRAIVNTAEQEIAGSCTTLKSGS
jgi:WD40 repeat protein